MSVELIEAITLGDVDGVKQHLDAGADPNFRLSRDEEYGAYTEERTALMFAAGEPRSNVEIVRILLESGADPLMASGAGVTAGWYACHGGFSERGPDDLERLRVLLDAGCCPHEAAYGASSCVYVAAQRGAIAQLRLLLERGASPEPIGDFVPLFEAARFGNLECVKALVEAGCPADYRDSKRNALSFVGSAEVAEYLWGLGVRSIPTDQGFDAIDRAIDEENIPVLRFLVSKAEPGVIQEKLIVACGSYMNPAAVRVLLEMGADPSMPDGNLAMPPLHWACWQGDGNMGRDDADVEETVQLLIDAGADPNFVSQGWTPLHEAAAGDWASPTSARVLLRNGAHVDPVDEMGVTPLMIAASNGSAELVRVLLEQGADPNLRDREGMTALDRAKESLRRTLPPGPASWTDATLYGVGWEAYDPDRQAWADRLAEEQEVVRLLMFGVGGERGRT